MSKIKEARKTAGLTQQQMSDEMGIPKRTIENWEAGLRKCPEWTEKLVVAELKRIKERKEIKNIVVMTAIANEIENRFKLMKASMKASKPEHAGKIYADIEELYEAYFELRGHAGTASFIAGVDNEANTVKSLFQMATEMIDAEMA